MSTFIEASEAFIEAFEEINKNTELLILNMRTKIETLKANLIEEDEDSFHRFMDVSERCKYLDEEEKFLRRQLKIYEFYMMLRDVKLKDETPQITID